MPGVFASSASGGPCWVSESGAGRLTPVVRFSYATSSTFSMAPATTGSAAGVPPVAGFSSLTTVSDSVTSAGESVEGAGAAGAAGVEASVVEASVVEAAVVEAAAVEAAVVEAAAVEAAVVEAAAASPASPWSSGDAPFASSVAGGAGGAAAVKPFPIVSSSTFGESSLGTVGAGASSLMLTKSRVEVERSDACKEFALARYVQQYEVAQINFAQGTETEPYKNERVSLKAFLIRTLHTYSGHTSNTPVEMFSLDSKDRKIWTHII